MWDTSESVKEGVGHVTKMQNEHTTHDIEMKEMYRVSSS